MVTAERQITSKLVALDDESRILAYAQTDDPRQFVRELGGGSKLHYQVRIYEVCSSEIDDIAHFYDFEATCLLRRETRQASPE